MRRGIRRTHVTCLKRVEPLSFKGERKSGLNAGGTAEQRCFAPETVISYSFRGFCIMQQLAKQVSESECF